MADRDRTALAGGMVPPALIVRSNRLFYRFSLHYKSPDSGEREKNTRTCKRRFDPALRASGGVGGGVC